MTQEIKPLEEGGMKKVKCPHKETKMVFGEILSMICSRYNVICKKCRKKIDFEVIFWGNIVMPEKYKHKFCRHKTRAK